MDHDPNNSIKTLIYPTHILLWLKLLTIDKSEQIPLWRPIGPYQHYGQYPWLHWSYSYIPKNIKDGEDNNIIIIIIKSSLP